MAYLNVRDRKIEATIAYVGAQLSGKATNFAQLMERVGDRERRPIESVAVGDGQRLSLDWQPRPVTRFNDCDLTVKLVTTHGAVPDGEVQRVLGTADGVVLVVDADPAALERNRMSIASVREALAREPRRPCPVVLQLNKGDLPHALPLRELAQALALETGDWPWVAACAASGDGVVETLEKALAGVVAAIREAAPNAHAAAAAEKTPKAPQVEGNPLLAALRQVLQATVSSHVAALEERLSARLEPQIAALASDVSALGSLRKLFSGLTELQTTVAATLTAADATTLVRVARDEIGEQTAAIERSIMAVLNAQSRAAEAHLERTLAALTATFEQKVRAERQALRDELRAEVVKSLEARSRSDREHLTSVLGQVQRAVDAVAANVTKTDARDALREISTSVEAMTVRATAVSERVDDLLAQVKPIALTVAALPAQLNAQWATQSGETHGRLQREIAVAVVPRVSEVGAAVADLALRVREASEAATRTEAQNTETHAAVQELMEDLKRRRKSWFT